MPSNAQLNAPYPCPECGYEGPHPVLLPPTDGVGAIIECGDTGCAAEFVVGP